MSGYQIGDYTFEAEEFLPPAIFRRITDVRVERPHVVVEEAQSRVRRPSLTTDGRLTILAADHPARLVVSVGDNPLAMADRLEYLSRVLRVVTNPEIDGVMGTPDIIEDLFIVNYLYKQGGGEGFLDEKVLLGCMNRGGLSGAIFEMDDTVTAFTPESIHELRLDGAKLMLRLALDEPMSGATLLYCARAISELSRYEIHAFLEILPVEKSEGKYKTKKNAGELAKAIGVASALGGTSRGTWLKIPYCEGYEAIARATTLPSLMLGGESRGDPTGTIREFAAGMKAGGAIRGALVGRNVTFPGKDDPLAVALAINSIVHHGASADEAIEYLQANRGRDMDFLTRCIAA